MAHQQMQKAPVVGGKFEDAYQAGEVRASVGPGDWFIVPSGVTNIGIELSFSGGGSGYVEATVEPVEVVQAGGAIGVPWPPGTVAVQTQRLLRGASAVRQVNVSGTSRLSARAN